MSIDGLQHGARIEIEFMVANGIIWSSVKLVCGSKKTALHGLYTRFGSTHDQVQPVIGSNIAIIRTFQANLPIAVRKS